MPENWRETLFVWDGILTVDKPTSEDDPTSPLKWSGTWTGVDNADATKIDAPKRGAFDAQVQSEMAFEVEGTASPATASSNGESKDDNNQKSADPNAGPFKATLTKGPGWDLKDEGTGETNKHQDTVHEIYLMQLRWMGSPDKTKDIVYARGENNFGPFISAGWMRPGNRITLGRRYLDENDARAKWDLEDLRKVVLEEICTAGGNVRIPPWQCSVLHVDDQSGKRRKVEADKDKAKAEEKEATKCAEGTAEDGGETKAEDSKEK